MDLSIVVPVFNEEAIIEHTLATINAFVSDLGLEYEILIVDDGSTDATLSKIKAAPVHVLSQSHKGKGAAVKLGIKHAKGRQILVTDCDLSVSLDQVRNFLSTPADFLICSRNHKLAKIKQQTFFRMLAGKSFAKLVQLVLNIPYLDTQCGCKILSKDAAKKISHLQKVNGFAFDAEWVFLAHHCDLLIEEVPVTWHNGKKSSVKVYRDAPKMFLELLQIRWNLLRGKYDFAK